MGKRRGRIGIVVVAVILLSIVGFFVVMRHAPPSAEQEAALKLMDTPAPPVRGSDASDDFWLLGVDVPRAQRAQVAAQIRAYQASVGPYADESRDPRSKLPRFPAAPEDATKGCGEDKRDCLAFVTAHQAQVAAVVAEHAGTIASYQAIATHDGYRRGFPETRYSGNPAFGKDGNLVPAAFALRFAQGEQLPAVDATCRDIAGWRRVGGDNDDLISSMWSVAWIRRDLMLLADMIAKLPGGTALPSACDQALQPSADKEFDLCPAMRSQFQVMRPSAEWAEAQLSLSRIDLARYSVVDWRYMDAVAALDYARYCEPSLPRRMRADPLADSLLPPQPGCTSLRRLSDPLGCRELEKPLGSWGKFIDRRADLAQMLALVRTVAWLRGQPEGLPQALAHRLASLELLREPDFDAVKGQLSIPMHDAKRWPRFEVAVGTGAAGH